VRSEDRWGAGLIHPTSFRGLTVDSLLILNYPVTLRFISVTDVRACVRNHEQFAAQHTPVLEERSVNFYLFRFK
jgi:hypothetical protein